MNTFARNTLIALSMLTQSYAATASQLIQWNSTTLYSQSLATDTFSDSVRFNVDSSGYVGVGVSFRDWTFTGSTTLGQFSASLIDESTNYTVATNFGSFFPNIGGTYFINPTILPTGRYTANVSLQVAGNGLLEVDVQSNTAPYASLSPISTVPEPTSYALMLAGLGAIGIFRSSRTRRVVA